MSLKISLRFEDDGKQKSNSCSGYLFAIVNGLEICLLEWHGQDEEESRTMLVNRAKDFSRELIQFLSGAENPPQPEGSVLVPGSERGEEAMLKITPKIDKDSGSVDGID